MLKNITRSPANIVNLCRWPWRSASTGARTPPLPAEGPIPAPRVSPVRSRSPAQSWVAPFWQIHWDAEVQLSELMLSPFSTPQALPSPPSSWNLRAREGAQRHSPRVTAEVPTPIPSPPPGAHRLGSRREPFSQVQPCPPEGTESPIQK